MRMELFLDEKKLVFEKVAQLTLKDPEDWGEDVIKFLLDKHPYVGKYAYSIAWKNRKDDRGYGLGYVEVKANRKVLKIPIIIDNNKLYDMDVFVADGRIYPLTQTRFEFALFSPDNLIGLEDKRIPSSLAIDPFGPNRFPPSRWFPFVKTGSLLRDIKDTMRKEHLSEVAEALKDDATAKIAFHKPEIMKCLQIMAESEKMEKKASSVSVKPPPPNVVQLVALPDGKYMAKCANTRAYRIDIEFLDRPAAIAKYGQVSVRAADVNQVVTAVESPSVVDDSWGETVWRDGAWKVMTVDGDILDGFVAKKPVDFSGNPRDGWLFFGSDCFSLQESIVGEYRGSVNFSMDRKVPSKGMGVFVFKEIFDCEVRSVSIPWKATVPFVIDRVETKGEEKRIMGHTLDGTKYTVVPTAVKTLINVKGTVLIPRRFSFIPVSKPVYLVNEMEKAAAYNDKKSVTIRYSGSFSFEGDGIAKVAKLHPEYFRRLDPASAVFVACSVGMSPEFAKEKLAQAMKYKTTTVKIAKELKPFEQFQEEVLQKVAKYKEAIDKRVESMRVCLVKEAVAIGDESTVDTILGINFLTPENISKFVDHLPELEKTQEKLCSMLIAVRLGLKKLPEGALKTTIKSLEKVIEGLRQLAHDKVIEELG